MQIKIVESNLNLRIPKGHLASDYNLPSCVAKSQLKYHPDIICNTEDMEGVESKDYNKLLESDYFKIAATDDKQRRGVSCWVKKQYKAKKIHSMTVPHLLHVRITNCAGKELNLIILRILISSSDKADFQNRWDQWLNVMQYLDTLAEKGAKNIALIGDWNHGVVNNIQAYKGKPRQFFNLQMIEKSLSTRNIDLVPIQGFSYKGYMAIDHLAISPSITAHNTRYEDIFGTHVPTIGIPDHSYIVSDLQLCG